MSRKYYLDDGIEYQPDSGELLVAGRVENLQSLENKLLLHFVTHPNTLISKEVLYQVGWEGRIHGDNPLSKAISNIRSKLRDSSKRPRYIKTIPKKGFKFISEVSNEPIEVTILVAKESTRPKGKTITQLAVTSTALGLLTWVSIEILSQDEHLSPQKISNFKQLTHTSSQERDPHLTQDGKYLVFARKLNQGSRFQLVAKPIFGSNEKILTDNAFDNLSPKWHSDGRSIIYHRFSLGQCEIVMLELDLKLNVTSEKMLTSCGKYSNTLGLSWGPGNTLYYSDIDIQFAAQKIYQLNIDNSKRQTIATPENTQGRGYYRVHYDPISNGLFALLSVDWYNTEVIRLTLEGEIVERHPVNMPLFSISTYNGKPVFRSTDNHIRYLDNGVGRLLMQSPLSPIFEPVFIDSQPPTLAFVGGIFHNTELLLIDLDKQTETVLTDDPAAHKMPVANPSGNLFFISNESGIYQIWKRSGNKTTQLSQFTDNLNIEHLAISNDEQYLALTANHHVYVYLLNNLPLLHDQPYMLLEHNSNPHFSPDSKLLWSSSNKQGIYQLKAVELANKKPFAEPIDNGYLGIFDRKTQQHFVFKYEQQGAWILENNQLQWFAEAPLITSSHSASIDQGILTYYSDEQAKILRLDLQTQQSTIVINAPYRHLTELYNQPNQWVVTRQSFGNTDIHVAQY